MVFQNGFPKWFSKMGSKMVTAQTPHQDTEQLSLPITALWWFVVRPWGPQGLLGRPGGPGAS